MVFLGFGKFFFRLGYLFFFGPKVIRRTSTSGQKGQTRGPPLSRVSDIGQETKEVDGCFFTDLW